MPTVTDDQPTSTSWKDITTSDYGDTPLKTTPMLQATVEIGKNSPSPVPSLSRPPVAFRHEEPESSGTSTSTTNAEHPGDNYLFTGNPRNPGIRRQPPIESATAPNRGVSTDSGNLRDDRCDGRHSSSDQPSDNRRVSNSGPAPSSGLDDLKRIAESALRKPQLQLPSASLPTSEIVTASCQVTIRDERTPGQRSLVLQPISPYPRDGKEDFTSPISRLPSGGISTNGLPPISPGSDMNNQTLPSIRSHLMRDIKHSLGDRDSLAQRRPSSNFGQSPPGINQLPPLSGGHGSPQPPISPADSYQRSLPSPGSLAASSPYLPHPSVLPHRSSMDLIAAKSCTEASAAAAEYPTPIQPHPAPSLATDRMSINDITNPQIGHYVCKVSGCKVPPFQTQYLLNSHANVHSSVRPHYCPVQGCSRSEGGKGFKRKNEMIRHGLVHESPGYICPFCPDRDHRYPRPDNLQRHVRVHHVDKNKDDPLLREVLSHRADGPSRGRRRRGGPL